jgi:hypothetical protein
LAVVSKELKNVVARSNELRAAGMFNVRAAGEQALEDLIGWMTHIEERLQQIERTMGYGKRD